MASQLLETSVRTVYQGVPDEVVAKFQDYYRAMTSLAAANEVLAPLFPEVPAPRPTLRYSYGRVPAVDVSPVFLDLGDAVAERARRLLARAAPGASTLFSAGVDYPAARSRLSRLLETKEELIRSGYLSGLEQEVSSVEVSRLLVG